MSGLGTEPAIDVLRGKIGIWNAISGSGETS